MLVREILFRNLRMDCLVLLLLKVWVMDLVVKW